MYSFRRNLTKEEKRKRSFIQHPFLSESDSSQSSFFRISAFSKPGTFPASKLFQERQDQKNRQTTKHHPDKEMRIPQLFLYPARHHPGQHHA